MNEMIERVARAIAKASNDDPDGLTGSLLNENERYWQHYVSQAQAAIEAMREPTQQMRLAGIAEWSRPDPTPEMIEAGRAAIRAFRESCGEVMDSELAEIAYRAMLDQRQ